MNNQPRRDVDHVYRRWMAGREDPDQLRQLGTRIVREACRCRRLDGRAFAQPLLPGLPRRVCLVSALALVLLAGAMWRGILTRPAPAGPNRWALIAEHEAEGDRRLFEGMQQLFSDDFRWVAEFNGSVSVGVNPVPGGTDPATRPLTVRFVVVARPAGGNTWRPVWAGDVLLRSDERVELAAGQETNSRLVLWAHALGDGRVAFEGGVHLDTPVPVETVVDGVFADGVPLEVASVEPNGSEYRLLQTVRML